MQQQTKKKQVSADEDDGGELKARQLLGGVQEEEGLQLLHGTQGLPL